jgi:integrase
MACVKKRRGKWVLDFRDHTGARRWETYETRRQADDALSKRIGELKGGVYRAPSDLPTFEAVTNDWLAGKRDRAHSTYSFLSGIVRRHYVPAFGPLRIDLVSTEAVEKFRNEKRDKMVPTTVNQLLQHLSAIFAYATKHGYIVRNPAAHAMVERVRRPRVADQLPEAIDPRSVLTGPQARTLIEASKPGLHRTFVATAVLSGCRAGELLGLTWAHVDLERRKLRISRSLSWDRTGGKGNTKPVFGPPKTDSSYRTLDIVPELATALREWKMRSRFKADEDLVFTTKIGGPLHLAVPSRGLKRALKKCPGLPAVSPHELRHTFASLLLLANKPVTQVARLLGHKDPTITLRVYSHWFVDAEDKNREAMADVAASIFADLAGSTVVATATA